MALTPSPGNIPRIIQILKSQGFSDVAISASLARFSAESKFDTKARNKGDGKNGGDSIGLLQWNEGRERQLKQFAKQRGTSPFDLETQVLHYVNEVKGVYGGEGKYGAKLLAARTPDQAAQAAISMARPRGWTPSNPSGGLGYKDTINDTRRFLSGDLTIRGAKKGAKTTTGATVSQDQPILTGVSNILSGDSKATDFLRGGLDVAGKMPSAADGLGEQFGPPIPDGFVSGNSTDSSSSADAVIDNSPMGKATQILAGLGKALADGNEEAKKNAKPHKSLLSEISGGPGYSPMVGQIRSMLRV